jgi:hypothetical protein
MYAEPIVSGHEARMKEAVAKLLPAIQGAYAGKDTAEVLKGIFANPENAETLKRPEIPWQEYNAKMAGPSGPVGGKAGLVGGAAQALWNVPGFLQNVARAGGNKLLKLAVGEYAPQSEMNVYTDPMDFIKGDIARVQALFNQEGNAPVAPPGYQPGAKFPRQQQVY